MSYSADSLRKLGEGASVTTNKDLRGNAGQFEWVKSSYSDGRVAWVSDASTDVLSNSELASLDPQ